ncbi:TM2 domain-containing protein [Brachyspira aalborgi]|uniref:TM2 domain-containing protein n=1 Tax=Brachyspira aalborgi TaxID=29522 RepID=A0A5C8DYQ7_9SPIR|nr:TM2 domain-containing protein [Brachyspira aalborgi]TXJ30333.1 TM2 domain-containing protein [Brachyspira aalborgi]
MSDNIQEKKFDEVYCASCGKAIKAQAELCPFCGVRQSAGNVSEKSLGTCLMLFIFLGWIAAHRFYAGKVGTAILYIITLNGIGIWWLIDLILILSKNFKDNENKLIKK